MGKTMHVPRDVRERIEKIIAEGVKKAEAHYGKMIKMPDIRYDVTGTCAGRAHHGQHEWFIDLNSVLLMENLESFSRRTPIHELAHMVCAVVYPETLAPRARKVTSTGRVRREKREVHGPRFYEVCDVLGMDEMSRCHGYDVTNAKKKVDKTIHTYQCAACQREYKLTAKRHTMFINGTRKYRCFCKGPIYLKGSLKPMQVGSETVLIAQSPVQLSAGKLGPTGDSKLAQCWRLYKQWHHSYNRKQMIAVFYQEADCTSAGASTYYAKCQQLFRDGYI